MNYKSMIEIWIIIPLAILSIFLFSCQGREATAELEEFRAQTATEKQNIEIVKLYVGEILNNGNLSMADSIIGAEFVDPASVAGEPGPEALKKVISYFRSTFPDLKVTIDEIFAHNDKVAWKWTAHGTQQGEIFGIAPTRNRVSFSGIIIDKIIDSKIVQRQGIWDRWALKEQLSEK
jgi:predicted ester cyclase